MPRKERNPVSNHESRWNKLNDDRGKKLEEIAGNVRLTWVEIAEKESHVAALRVWGHSNSEIAGLLDITPSTTDNYTNSVRKTLGISRDVNLSEYLREKLGYSDIEFAQTTATKKKR
jgi:DNA-binding CsgD family transcriptional regulator